MIQKKLKNLITIQILKITFGIYFIVTLTVTLIHMRAEYLHMKQEVLKELYAMQETFEPVLTQALWRLDRSQWQSTLEGMMRSTILVGIKLQENNKILFKSGMTLDEKGKIIMNMPDNATTPSSSIITNLFNHQFALTYLEEQVGVVTLYSSNAVIYQKVKIGFLFILLNAIIKSIALWFLFIFAGYRLLNRPLSIMTKTIKQFDFNHLKNLKIDIQTHRRNELKFLEEAFNAMIEKLNVSITKLKENERRLTDAQHIAKIGDFTWDLETNQIVWSNSLYHILKYDPTEQIDYSKVNKDIHFPEDLDAITKWINDSIASGNKTLPPHEYRIICKDHHVIYVRTLGVIEYDNQGKALRIFATVQDISHQKEIENALAQEKERLLVTLRSIGDGVITTDTKGYVVLINKVAEVLTGWTQTEAFGKHVKDVFNIINATTRQRCDNPVEKVLTAKTIIGLANHTKLIARDGTERIIEDSGAPIFDSNNDIIGVVLVFRDVTEKYKFEKQLQQNQKLESIGTLAGGIAHDFNNLLSVITGNISQVLYTLNKDDDLYDILADVQEGAQQAQHLTHQLLTFSKGGAPIKKVSNINQLVKDAAIFSTRGTKSTCHFELSSDLWATEIDEGQINQVIHNLIINANQAMPNGGIITIKTENAHIKNHSIMPLHNGQYIKILVEDQGIGISENHLQNIFDPYFTTKQKGSGLGLATSYSIINQHNGHISVYSEIDKGTVFCIYLPASLKTMTNCVNSNTTSHQGKGNILIMDDQESILKMLARMLNRMGYETESAMDGKQAIEKFKTAYDSNTPFDLVILDLTVPGGMGGTKTVIELLKIDPNVKAVVSSGYSNDPIMANYQDYGFCGVVPKPYTKNQLAELLNQLNC